MALQPCPFWLLIFIPGKRLKFSMQKDNVQTWIKSQDLSKLFRIYKPSANSGLFCKVSDLLLFTLQSMWKQDALLQRNILVRGGPESSFSTSCPLWLIPIVKTSAGLLPQSVYFPLPGSQGASWPQGLQLGVTEVLLYLKSKKFLLNVVQNTTTLW